MIDRYVAVDIGSRTIKACSVVIKRKEASLLNFTQKNRPEDKLEFNRVIDNLLKEIGATSRDKIIVGLSDSVFVRKLSFPFHDNSKIFPLIGYEMDDKIPMDIDDAVVANSVPERVGDSGATLLAAAASKEVVSDLIECFKSAEREIFRLVFSPQRATVMVPQSPQPVMVVDMGSRRTELTIIKDGKLVDARILTGGVDSVMESLAQYSGQSIREIEKWMEHSGAITEFHADEEGFEKIIREKTTSEMENWRRFLSNGEKAAGAKIENIFITGRGASLKGIKSWSEKFFDLKCELSVGPVEGATIENGATLSLALLGTKQRNEIIDFRSGIFAKDASYSLVKEKALSVVLGISIFLVFMSVSGFLTLNRLEKSEKNLLMVVSSLSKEVLGKRTTNPYYIKRKIKKMKKKSKKGSIGENPLPQMSAYVLLSEISKKLPPRKEIKKDEDTKEKEEKPKSTPALSSKKPPLKEGEVKLEPIALDISEIKIKPGKVKLSGTVDNAKDVDEIIKSLKKIECFNDIKPGKIKSVGKGENEKKQFSIEIEMTCL
jgi:cell division ATPase FtsA